MNSRLIKIAAAVALLCAAARPARAERALTLTDAFALAEKNNLDLQAAGVRLQQSSLTVKQAIAALLPTVNLQGKYTRNYINVEFQLPGSDNPVTIQKGNQLDALVNIQAPIFAPAAYPGLDAAKTSEVVAKDSFTVTKTQVMFGVAQAFYAAAGTDELVTARKNAVAVAEETLSTTKTRLESGVVTRLDVSRAENALVRAQTALDEAVASRDAAYRSLTTLLQAPEPVRVVSGEISLAPSKEAQKRPEIALLEDSIKLAGLEEKTARWRWFPTLSAFGTGRLSNYAGFNGDKYFWAVGLQLDWQAFDGGARRLAQERAELTRIENETRLVQQSKQIADEVANSRQSVETKQRSVSAAQRSVELSREALELVRIRYEAGQATQLDVLQAQDALVNSEVGLAQTRFELALASLSQERATGSFQERFAAK